MAENRGKQFESIVQESFEKLANVSIDRLHDQTTGFKGSTNICDFIVYKEPYEYYIECKSVHKNTMSIYSPNPKKKYGNITNTQWEGLLEKSKIQGVRAGVLIWFIDRDVTKFVPIQTLVMLRAEEFKSVKYDMNFYPYVDLVGIKKRVFFDYDMEVFFREVDECVRMFSLLK